MTLRSAIQEIHDRDDDQAAIERNKTDFIEGWTRELSRLYDLLGTFLSDLVAEGQLKLTIDSVNVTEDDLGTYSAPRLNISIGSRNVYASPVARLTVGGRGRVDLMRDDRPSERDRYRLLKGVGDSGWRIESKQGWMTDPVSRAIAGFNQVLTPKTYTLLTDIELEKALENLIRL